MGEGDAGVLPINIAAVSFSGTSVLNKEENVIVLGSCVEESVEGKPEPSSVVDNNIELASAANVDACAWVVGKPSSKPMETEAGLSVLDIEEGECAVVLSIVLGDSLVIDDTSMLNGGIVVVTEDPVNVSGDELGIELVVRSGGNNVEEITV